jgi:hypothetical protein
MVKILKYKREDEMIKKEKYRNDFLKKQFSFISLVFNYLSCMCE